MESDRHVDLKMGLAPLFHLFNISATFGSLFWVCKEEAHCYIVAAEQGKLVSRSFTLIGLLCFDAIIAIM